MRIALCLFFFLAFSIPSSAQELAPIPAAPCHTAAPTPVRGKQGPRGLAGPSGPVGPAGPAGQVPQWYLWAALGGLGLGLLATGLAIGALSGRPAPAAPVVVNNYPHAAPPLAPRV